MSDPDGVRVGDLIAAADELWPPVLAEPWDNPGLAVGDPQALVRRVLVTVDAVPAVLDEAEALGCEAIVSHHPTLFASPRTLRADTWPGALLTRAAGAGVALFSAHTNADAAPGGVNDALADALGMSVQREPIEPGALPGSGIGRVGELTGPLPLQAFAARVAEQLPGTAGGVLVQGHPEAMITTVAVCSGSGADFLEHPAVQTADCYVTADLKHHQALDVASARAAGLRRPALVGMSHWAGESLWVRGAVAALTAALPVQAAASRVPTDPWTFRVDGQSE
jgi:dinuclear metal center YbgI/SA1388 family protein